MENQLFSQRIEVMVTLKADGNSLAARLKKDEMDTVEWLPVDITLIDKIKSMIIK